MLRRRIGRHRRRRSMPAKNAALERLLSDRRLKPSRNIAEHYGSLMRPTVVRNVVAPIFVADAMPADVGPAPPGKCGKGRRFHERSVFTSRRRTISVARSSAAPRWLSCSAAASSAARSNLVKPTPALPMRSRSRASQPPSFADVVEKVRPGGGQRSRQVASSPSCRPTIRISRSQFQPGSPMERFFRQFRQMNPNDNGKAQQRPASAWLLDEPRLRLLHLRRRLPRHQQPRRRQRQSSSPSFSTTAPSCPPR